ncbi:MAG: fumarate/nitrate reduction transcriptional regulator Fnr [Wenzhouxiangellaceae bacterium]
MSRLIDIDSARTGSVSCTQCALFDLCFAHELTEKRRHELEEIVHRQRPLPRDQHLYLSGDKLKRICVVQAGMVKSYRLSSEGDEIITGFHLPGEMIGLDAIGTGEHPEYAVALEDSRYCEIPFPAFERMLDQHPEIGRLMLRLLALDMSSARETALVIGRMEARPRIAMFLLDLSRRLERRGADATRFRLAMDRRDIANYLGLTVETVSRIFSGMQRDGLIRARGKAIQLLDREGLLALIGPEHEELLGEKRLRA